MLQMSIKKVIGKRGYTFILTGENLHQVIMEAQKLSFQDVYKCGKCESDHLYLWAYTTKQDKYEYIKIVCAECKASITFGKSKKDKDTYYLRKADNGDLDWQEFSNENRNDD